MAPASFKKPGHLFGAAPTLLVARHAAGPPPHPIAITPSFFGQPAKCDGAHTSLPSRPSKSGIATSIWRQEGYMALEEGVSDHRHKRMTMKALPGSSLEVVKTKFFFHLLVSLLANPTRLDGGC